MRMLACLSLTMLFSAASCWIAGESRAADAPAKARPFTMSPLERAIVDLTNKEREKKGLPALKPNPQLFQAARAHSANMARQGKLAHVLDGKGHTDRMTAAGYSDPALENCAMGQRTPQQVVTAWMSDDGHRNAILDKNATEIGIGVAYTNRGVPYYTQDFGKAQP